MWSIHILALLLKNPTRTNVSHIYKSYISQSALDRQAHKTLNDLVNDSQSEFTAQPQVQWFAHRHWATKLQPKEVAELRGARWHPLWIGKKALLAIVCVVAPAGGGGLPFSPNPLRHDLVYDGLVQRSQLARPLVQRIVACGTLALAVQLEHLVHLVNAALDHAVQDTRNQQVLNFA